MIDLRSDTVTQPPEEMRQAMANAEVGDDYYGDDATVGRLERLSAEVLGKEDALFVTSGTMGNLVSILAQTRRGDSIVCESKSHVFHNERGHIAAVCGVLPICVDSIRGAMDPRSIQEAVFGDTVLNSPTRLICLENSHNVHGGTCLGSEYLLGIRALADRLEVGLHLDGARIFNAATALKIPVATLARTADSLTFCLSKGLACPFGSVVVGGRDFIRQARRQRQMVGGGLRQAGIMAAAGIFALQRMVDRLQEDHDHALDLARGLQEAGLQVEMDRVQTNMVFFRLPVDGPSNEAFHESLTKRGVLVNKPRSGRFRMVTHYGIHASDVSKTIEAAAQGLNSDFTASDSRR